MGDEKPKDGGMREAMPDVTAFIDSMREVFGKSTIDKAIKQGMKDGTFFAAENTHGATGDALWTDPRTVMVGNPFCYYPRGVAPESTAPLTGARKPRGYKDRK